MPDVPMPAEPEEQDEEFADKLIVLRNKLDDAARVTLTGDPKGRIRRKVLFIVAAIALLLAGSGSIVTTIISTIGLFALLALAMTDEVVDLG